MMIRMMFALSLGFAGLIYATKSVHAQTGAACAARQMVIDTLAQTYGETRRSIGMTCLMASGQGYETVAEELPAKGDPA